MSSENIQLLVDKAKNADKEAFGSLYEIYSREMFRFAYWYLGDKFSAEDAVSDAVVNAFISVKSLKRPEKFKSWLFTILLRSCQKQLKSIIGMRRTAEIGELSLSDEKASPEESAELKAALDILGDEDREIFLLSTVGGLTSKEIGSMLSMPAGTVRSKISRSADKLYDVLNTTSVR